jgi:phosphoglycolate phosphatase-like HAD superfamily hydrolase
MKPIHLAAGERGKQRLCGIRPFRGAASSSAETRDSAGKRNRCWAGKCSTNATAAETRWPALQLAGVHELFAVGLVSYSLNVRKDDPLFYELVITAARCPAGQVVFVGDRIDYDVAAPMRAGMQACLVRPGGLRPDELLPDGASMIGHVRELPALLELTC